MASLRGGDGGGSHGVRWRARAVCAHLDGVTELHPGNYLFFDTTQARLGACDRDAEVACRVLTRVVGHYARSNTLLVDLGWTGCSALCTCAPTRTR